MIFNILFNALTGILAAVLSALPPAGNLGLSTVSHGWFVGYAWADSFLPVHEIFAALGIYFGIRLVVVPILVAFRIYEWLPFKFS